MFVRLKRPGRALPKIIVFALVGFAFANLANGSSLSDAARDGSYLRLKQLLEQGVDINFTDDPHTPTALAIIVSKGNTDMANYLIQHGANANALNPGSGCNLLQLAAGAFNTPERIQMVELLTEAGSDMNFLSRRCATPLIEAAIAGHFNTVVYLTNKKANLDHQYQGNSALFEAVINGHHDIATLLIDKGANIDLPSIDGATALHLAAQLAPQLYHKMAQAGAQHSVDKNGRGVLGYAIGGNKTILIKQLLQQPVQQSELDDALYLAVGKLDITLINTLLARGANPLLRDRWGDSAMTSALKINNPEINLLLGIQLPE